jgi:hypothetical protein
VYGLCHCSTGLACCLLQYCGAAVSLCWGAAVQHAVVSHCPGVAVSLWFCVSALLCPNAAVLHCRVLQCCSVAVLLALCFPMV